MRRSSSRFLLRSLLAGVAAPSAHSLPAIPYFSAAALYPQSAKEYELKDRGFSFRQYSTRQYGSQWKRSPTPKDQNDKKCVKRTDLKSKPDNDDPELKHIEDEEPQISRTGKNISAADKKKFLVNTLLDLKESKDVVYGTLDAWIAWEQDFPLALLKRAIQDLEKEQQWHKIVQVIKWMLSKGQGTTMRTYEQLVRALEKDGRPEEAHNIWVKKVGYDLHSVPWSFCDLMLSVYYRNNMLERLVKLFKELEENGRKPPYKSIVTKVEVAYELLGLLDEKKKLLERYGHLFKTSSDKHGKSQKIDKGSAKKESKAVHIEYTQVEAEPSKKFHSAEDVST